MLLERNETKTARGHFSANAIKRVIDVLEKESSCHKYIKMHKFTPDQGQDALNKLATTGVGLQHIRQARAILVNALQQKARRQDFLSLVTLTQSNFRSNNTGNKDSNRKIDRCCVTWTYG
jgi:hypothetical protein